MLEELPYGFWVTVAVALGLTLGSFLNVVIYRLPRGENVAHPASRCPGCGKPIAPYDNIPVLSWLVLRGKARCCGTKISARYPLIELVGGMAGWAVLQQVFAEVPGDAAAWVPLALFWGYLVLCLGLVAAVFIDLEFMLLPDELTLGGAALGLLMAPVRHVAWTDALLGAATGFLVVWLPFVLLYRLVRGQAGMGLGDAKLLLLTGTWFGWQGALFALLAGAVQGTVVALAVVAAHGRIEEPAAVKAEREELRRQLDALEGEARERLAAELAQDPIASEPDEGLGKARVPFGPFLAIATIEYLFFGETLVGEYLRVLSAG